MVAIVNMSLWRLMHGTAPDHSTHHEALMHILHQGCAPMVCCIVTCLRSFFLMKPGGAVAGVVRQVEMADHRPMQTGRLHILIDLHLMLKGLHPMLKGGLLMWRGHLMQKDHGPHIQSRPANWRNQCTDPCQQWSILLLWTRSCSRPHHLQQGVS